MVFGCRELGRISTYATAAREQGLRIGMAATFGDLLHRGHLDLLEAASELCDTLIVDMGDDAECRRSKGPGRPVIAEGDRVAMVHALACVDHVVLMDSAVRKEAAIAAVLPDIYVRGGEYTPGRFPEAAIMARIGGRCIVHGRPDREHTTAIIARIKGLPR